MPQLSLVRLETELILLLTSTIRPGYACIQSVLFHRLAVLIYDNFLGSNAFLIYNEEAANQRQGLINTPPRWMAIVAPILFLEPVTQMQELRKIFTDNIGRVSRWNAFSSRMKSELQDSNLLASLPLQCRLLSCN